MQLSWLDQFQFAGYYMAKEKGFYSESNLDVTIQPYAHPLSVIEKVTRNRATYGIGRSNLLIERSRGAKITALAAIFQSSPLVLIALKRPDLQSVEAFKGKRIMALEDVESSAIFHAMITSHNVNLTDMHLQPHSMKLDDLITGKTDLMACYLSNEPYLLKESGHDYSVFDPKDHGFDFYSDILFTSEDEAKNHPQRANRFLQASLKGWEYAFAHIEETAALIHQKYNAQNKSIEALIFEAKTLKKLAYGNTNALGNIDISKLERIFTLYKIMHLTHSSISYNDFLFSRSKVELNSTEQDYIQNADAVNVCIDTYVPPYTIEMQNGFSGGITSDYFKLISAHSGLKFTHVPISHDDNISELFMNHQCDMIPCLNINNPLSHILHVSHQYLQDDLALATAIRKPYIDDLSHIKNKKIAFLKGLHHSAIALKHQYPHIEFVEVSSMKAGISKVLHSGADGFIAPYRSLAYLIQKHYITELKIAIKLDSPMIEIGMGINKNDPILLSIINKTLRSFNTDETRHIYRRWMEYSMHPKPNYSFFIKLLIGMSFVLLFFFYRQNIQKKKNKELEMLRKKLEDLNHSLEKKVSDAVMELRKKDQIMMHQSRLAQLGEMISMIAHQWRQPLSAISSTVVSMQLKNSLNKFDLSNPKERDAYKSYLNTNFEQIENYVSTLSNTIDDFRNFYKSEKISSCLCVNDVLEKTLKIIESALIQDNITLIKNFCSEKKVNVYENELLQVFLNIIQNAQDNFKDNSVTNRVLTIDTFDTPDGIAVEMHDNGGGISKTINDLIYDPYFSTKEKKNGTGLGLYMSKMIIEAHHHGRLHHKNENDGVCFCIEING